MLFIHTIVWIVVAILLPLFPIALGWIIVFFMGGATPFTEYAAEIVQDGQLCFYSVAIGCAEGLEVWEWHEASHPYRGIVAVLCMAAIAASLVMYGIIAAVKEAKTHSSTLAAKEKAIAVVSIVIATVSAILVTLTHVWIKWNGG
ncbi:hypothetical protein ACFSHT_10500 [Paraburkholderia silviterrae]|uniref:Uncharacterized protein n=1 Tax=Paraburkholderia silviterrae TaxID=2528715 RepID=A0A4R5ME35_9BURK|nr:hypothetical protein [Paraburkholderia silviterrae]TDG25380.1 hypothetical protein EYW47_05980 [Paraburkholderia silviterrae]